MRYSRQLPLLALVALSTTTLAVLAHGDDEHGSGHDGGHMTMDMGGMHGGHNNASVPAPPPSPPASSVYFTYPEHKGWLYLHILTMTISWVGIMPIALMLFLAGSRLHLPAQALFLIMTAVGIVFSTIYNSLTPDLYPNNSHHKMGWALVLILAAQAIMGVLGVTIKKVTGPARNYGSNDERAGFMAVPVDSPTDSVESHYYRRSASSSIRRDSHETNDEEVHLGNHDWNQVPVMDEKNPGSGMLSTEGLERALQKHAPFVFNDRVVAGCEFFYSLVAYFMVALAFTQICLGIITASGIFTGSGVFNGLAHWIKGGLFFLYGIFTLARFLGAFADFGWAWNTKPENYATGKKSRAVSAETIESGLFFVYGISNVFLEHLAGWGQAWSHADLQHASIAFMFLGGGLCGLLIESSRVRALLNFSNSNTSEQKLKGVSINPMPALIIFLLGILMSQHHQHSAMSTMIHTQWGTLLAGAAVFRLLTYMTFYRSATSVDTTPTRPPTEIIASFCLLAGGLVFMMSSRDTVNYLESIGVDPMFCLTVVVGLVALLMSWIVVVMAIKGWAAKRVASQSMPSGGLSIDTRGAGMA